MRDNWRGEKLNHWFTNEWISSFGTVRVAFDPEGAAEGFEVETAEPQAAQWGGWQKPTWLELRGAGGAALVVGAPFSVIAALTTPVLGSADDEPALLEVFREMLAQATAGAGAAAPGHGSKQLSFAPAEPVSSAPKPDLAVELRFEIGGEPQAIVLAPSRELIQTLYPQDAPPAAPPPSQVPAAPSDDDDSRLQLSSEARQNLQMLLDVDLELSVSFGQTKLLLQDVLKLSSGSIVELNRSISEPVNVLVNDFVVARGEVVVVDGNYGVRITEIATRQERIRSIL